MMREIKKVQTIYKNTVVVLFTQIFTVLLGFIVRRAFVYTLGINYLGYNSVFTNVLQMLNLADLGIGVAITSFLYKPIAEENTEKIKVLMYIYKKIYQVLGFLVAVLGIGISFFLTYIIPDAVHRLSYLQILFYINLIGSVSTYYLAYKRTLLVASQKTYITSGIDSGVYFIVSCLQIAILYLYPNYIVFLAITVMKNICSNFIISFYCGKECKYLKEDVDKTLIQEYKKIIIEYVKDVFVSKVGAYIFYSTDNIIISIFKGSILTGYLSNYTLITNQVKNIIVQILSSVQATFGIYINSENSLERQKNITDNYLYANYLIGNFCFLCIVFLIQPFVELWVGSEFLLPTTTVMLLGINLMFTILIQLPSQLFVIYKLYKYDKLIIAVSAILNIIISIALVSIWGLNGVLVGTFVTSLIYLYCRFYIVSHMIFKTSFRFYILRLFRYYAVSLLSLLLIYILTARMNFEELILSFILKMIVVVVGAIVIPGLLTCRTNEFRFVFTKFVGGKLKRTI